MSLCRWLAIAMVVVPCAHAQVAAPPIAAGTTQSTAAVPGKGEAAEGAAPKRRLKFKGDRPTCTCASALGESDIQAAEAKSNTEQQTRRSEK